MPIYAISADEPVRKAGDVVPQERLGPKEFLLAHFEADNCHFYNGILQIWPDGFWGWHGKVKSFRSGKEWGNRFVLVDQELVVLWISDFKYKLLLGGGNEEDWSEGPIGPDAGVKAAYLAATNATIQDVRTNP